MFLGELFDNRVRTDGEFEARLDLAEIANQPLRDWMQSYAQNRNELLVTECARLRTSENEIPTIHFDYMRSGLAACGKSPLLGVQTCDLRNVWDV